MLGSNILKIDKTFNMSKTLNSYEKVSLKYSITINQKLYNALFNAILMIFMSHSFVIIYVY